MEVIKHDVEAYLKDVRVGIKDGRCRIELNNKREDNLELFNKYLITEKDAYSIISGLSVQDFSEAVRNTHSKYSHETLYIFGKQVRLLERYGTNHVLVSLYIKINKLDSGFVIVVSFHEQRYPLKRFFDDIN